MRWSADTVELVWHGIRPIDLEERVRRDLRENLEKDLGRPGDLIYHHVQLSPDYEGPSVTVWGEDGDPDRFHLEYSVKTEWKTLAAEGEGVDEVKVVESCGCVFCDLGIEPNDLLDGVPAHRHESGVTACSRDPTNPAA